MPFTPSNLVKCFYNALVNTINHDGVEHAGYLAFLGLLALFPFLVVLVTLAGVFGEDVAKSELVAFVISYLPPHVVSALEPRVLEITTGPSQGLLTIAILGALWTASSAVEGLRTVLNRAYHVHTPPAYLLRRLLSIGQLLVLIWIVIVGMALLVIWPVLWEYILPILPFKKAVILAGDIQFLSYAVGAVLLFIVVSSLYFVLPNIRQTWISVVPGAVVVVVLWMLAAKLFAFYLSSFEQVNIIYGSLGGIIATLLFFYILSLIFIYGAEFSYLLKKMQGEHIQEKEKVAKT